MIQKKVREGDLFVAFKGLTRDGHTYISEAISKGAKAIVTEKPLEPQRCLQ